MLPFLQLTADGNTYRLREAVDLMAEQFELSEKERREMLPSSPCRQILGISAAYYRYDASIRNS